MTTAAILGLILCGVGVAGTLALLLRRMTRTGAQGRALPPLHPFDDASVEPKAPGSLASPPPAAVERSPELPSPYEDSDVPARERTQILDGPTKVSERVETRRAPRQSPSTPDTDSRAAPEEVTTIDEEAATASLARPDLPTRIDEAAPTGLDPRRRV